LAVNAGGRDLLPPTPPYRIMTAALSNGGGFLFLPDPRSEKRMAPPRA
jgi:hypothetical protein